MPLHAMKRHLLEGRLAKLSIGMAVAVPGCAPRALSAGSSSGDRGCDLWYMRWLP
jgi:hypothetical protein